MNVNSNQLRILHSVALLPVLFVPSSNAQETSELTEKPVCSINLDRPATMSNIASNALMHKYHKDADKVSGFLDAMRGKYSKGNELAVAVAKEFGVDEQDFFAAMEEYKHINCSHEGGGEEDAGKDAGKKAAEEISQFSEDVLFHVVLHEIGHGLVREFDLPILGNEETLADTFATHYIASRLPPERALRILKARVDSLMIEAREVPREEWTIKGEHNSDARRAYQIAASAIAYDAKAFKSLAAIVDMSESNFRGATDYGSEIHRSWRRILKSLWMPTGEKSTEARVIIEQESKFSDSLSAGKMVGELEDALKSFDWHSQVKLRFASGSGGAGWNRSTRTVTVHDGYIQRFISQGETAGQSD